MKCLKLKENHIPTLSQEEILSIKQPKRYAETRLYYYGARYYDPKLSVWLSTDPMAEKYPSMSPYNYAANNPVKYIDPDGRDFRLNIYQDGNGQWHIDISTTVYLVGKNSAQKMKSYNEYVAKHAEKLRGQYQSKEGINYKVNIKIEYQEGTESTINKLKEQRNVTLRKPKTSGNNILELSEKPVRSKVFEKGGYKGILGAGEYFSSSETALHESLHFLGLGDRYSNDLRSPREGFETDIMSCYFGDDWEFKDIHFENIAEKTLDIWNNNKGKKEVGVSTIVDTVNNKSKE